MNTIDLLLSHHSVRQFSGQSIAEETLQRLIAGAQAAPTSHYVQAYSIIGITDPALKQALAAISGQAHALNNARLLVFIADFNRHAELLEDKQYLGSTENLLVAAIDASLAAQNLCIAAESLGIGCCYLGSLRNQVAEIIRLLELPRFTFPLFGIALGYPAADADSEQKPRLQKNTVVLWFAPIIFMLFALGIWLFIRHSRQYKQQRLNPEQEAQLQAWLKQYGKVGS